MVAKNEGVNAFTLTFIAMCMLPYWPFAGMAYLLLREDEKYGDCPGWLKLILNVVDAPRKGLYAWGRWVSTE